jgi:Helix-turn-helix domain
MSEKNATPPEKQAALEAIRIELSGQDTHTQRERLLAALRRFKVNTNEARRFLDIYSPCPRVFELRHELGFKIHTHWETVTTEAGEKHRVGSYVLESSDGQ